MIDPNTISAIATAQGKDPAEVGIVFFYLPPTHPLADRTIVAALGTVRAHPASQSITAIGPIAFGATPEEAAKALFTILQTDIEASEAAAVAAVTAIQAAKDAIATAVAADATVEDIKP